MKNRHKKWVQICLLVTAFLPAFMTQTMLPFIGREYWEDLADVVYKEMSSFFWLNPSSARVKDGGRVAIISIGPNTYEKLGKPIKNEYFIKFLHKLRSGGSPWVVSFINFSNQAVNTTQTTPTRNRKLKALKSRRDESNVDIDQKLVEELKLYGKFIGSSISLQSEKMFSNIESQDLQDMAKFMIPAKHIRLPFMPVTLDEPRAFVAAKLFSGLAPSVDYEHPYCFHPFFKDENSEYMLPTSLLWLAALSERNQIVADDNFSWPVNDSPEWAHFRKKIRVGSTVCLSQPQQSCIEFAQKRDIFSLEFVDLIQDELKGVNGEKISLEKILAGRSLILAESNQTVADPFVGEHSGLMIHPYDIYARYLDTLLSQNFMIKQPLDSRRNFSAMPLILGAVIAVGSFVLSFRQVIFLIFLILVNLVLFTFYHLSSELSYVVPIQSLASISFSLILSLIFWNILIYFERRNMIRLTKNIQAKFSQANSLVELQNSLQSSLRFDFRKCDLAFFGFDLQLHEAANDPRIAVDYLLQLGQHTNDVEKAIVSRLKKFRADQSMPPGLIFAIRSKGGLFEKEIRARIPLAMDFEGLGYCEIKLTYREQDYSWVTEFLENLRVDLSLSVNRIQGLAIRNLSDQAYIQKSWQYYFLGQMIPQKQFVSLPDHVSFNANFERVMTPQVSKMAVLRVAFDIVDESRLAANYTDVFKIINGYYDRAYSLARQYGMVKFLGDHIWFFVDESLMEDQSASDFLLRVASIILQDSTKLNYDKREEEKILPRAYLHVSGCIVGNLLSKNMIDYSVMGKNVTKLSNIENHAGSDERFAEILASSLILSEEAFENLKTLSHLRVEKHVFSSPIQLNEYHTPLDLIYHLPHSICLELSK